MVGQPDDRLVGQGSAVCSLLGAGASDAEAAQLLLKASSDYDADAVTNIVVGAQVYLC
ncbi:DUF732 domain-containing protein [Kineococcus indalonis]|uniref:DUF732 domain-containing protein n=1 Tax=Kineococcus indalonis TaxID=2696566 RepID=UPI00141256C1|nr:DUF732 domain-containing protein [Kineococcus indalonis]NAZ87299.1 DUF732 domain-containing protein [Kineococcus indalonis]